MARKLRVLLLLGLMVLVVGCGKDSSNDDNSDKEVKENKPSEKVIVCTGEPEKTSQDEMELQQSYKFYFVDDEIKDFELVQRMKLLKDTEENKKQLKEQDEKSYKESFEAMYEAMGEEAPKFDVKFKDISDLEREVTMTFDFKEFAKTNEIEEELAEYTKFEDFKKNALNEIKDENMVCTYDGKIIE